ncbi:hypothetical protein ACWGE0_11210 [Lentzea sp. NPDC054927]
MGGAVRAAVRAAPEAIAEIDSWLDHFRRFWEPHLDALETELARGRRERRLQEEAEDD